MIPNQTNTVTDQVFHSSGEFGQFMNFYLDGRELRRDQDYVAEDGSTKITVRAQTFRNAGNGVHTISAEFRTGASSDGVMRRTAQNFQISNISGGGSSSGGSGSSGSSSSDRRPSTGKKPSTTAPSTAKPQTSTPEDPKTTADIFRDINADHWFYPDVDWAYRRGLMVGVTDDTYKPYDAISPATVVVVLSRLNGADLSPWAETAAEGVEPGKWYSAAASWARVNNLLPEGFFNPEPPMTRGAMAEMLVKYLQLLGIDCTLPASPVDFKDAALMTDGENAAFQVLYQFGIFKGVGNYTMNVAGSTTRGQFSALLHRLSVFVGE